MSKIEKTKLEVRQWEYIFSRIKDYDLKNFNRDNMESVAKMMSNGKLFYALYKELFQKVSKGSKTLVKLSDFAFSFTSLPPKNIADNAALNELYAREAKSKDYSNSTFYFELFSMEWERFIHIYTNAEEQLIDFFCPKWTINEDLLFSLGIDINFSLEKNDAGAFYPKLDMSFDFRKTNEMTISQFGVYQNLFGIRNQNRLIIEVKYQPTEKEVAQFVNLDDFEMPKTIRMRSAINPNGKIVETNDIDKRVDSNVNPSTMLSIDTSQNPAVIQLINVDFLRNSTAPFQIFVVVTKKKRLFREGMIDFNGKKMITKSDDVITSHSNNIVIHTIESVAK